uniref:Uncharacterized protein n=1 Tax=Prymnesium polylepis TaxID=72548 RepID=A0A7S4JCV8_9EUKA
MRTFVLTWLCAAAAALRTTAPSRRVARCAVVCSVRNAVGLDVQRAAHEIQQTLLPVDAARPGEVQLVGDGAVTRPLSTVHAAAALDEFLSSPELSDAHLLNTVNYEALADGSYMCEMAALSLFAYCVTPVVTVRIDRSAAAQERELLIRVVDVRLHVQRGGAAPWVLQGTAVESHNRVSWDVAQGAAAADDAERAAITLRTELTLRVRVQLPPRFPLPHAAIERPASLLLRATSDAQCRQFLSEIERGFERARR